MNVTRPLATLAFVLALTPVASPAPAQDTTTIDQRVEVLRAQLRDVTDKQAQLQAREQQLDEEMKPENIEHSLAGVGTTDAAALREQRRQQLERERAAVEEQLQSLASSRSHLEASVASAEAEAVRLKAATLGANNVPQQADGAARAQAATPAQSKLAARPAKGRRRKRVRRRTH